jgi:hypothetical protein
MISPPNRVHKNAGTSSCGWGLTGSWSHLRNWDDEKERLAGVAGQMQALVKLTRAGASDVAPERRDAETDAGAGEDAGARVAVEQATRPPSRQSAGRSDQATYTDLAIHRNFDKLLTTTGVRCPSIGSSC